LIEGSKAYAIDRERIRMMGELGAVEANTARAEGRISEIELQILAVEDAARTEAQRELRSLEASISELDERRRAIADRLANMEIRSPIAGVINELNVTTVGGVITPAEALVTVVPDDADLKVEFRMRTMDVDQIGVGQPVKLRLSAFNQRTTPEIDGIVAHVSAASQRDTATGETFYLGEVEITGDLAALGGMKLVPGMPVEVFVQTEEMTAISYLAKPFTDQMARAFREE
jgi:HlyD family secretion protein